jgi:flagellar motor switch protein FliN/FliY
MSSSFLSQTEIEQLLARLDHENKETAGEGAGPDEHQPLPCGADTAPDDASVPESAVQGAKAYQPGVKHGPAQQDVERVSFPELREARLPGKNSLELLYDTPVTLMLELGSAELKVGEVLALQKNSVIKLDRLTGENMTLLVNGRPLALGEVVVINENFGFRVTAVGDSMHATAEKG